MIPGVEFIHFSPTSYWLALSSLFLAIPAFNVIRMIQRWF